MSLYPNKSAGWIPALLSTTRHLKWGLAVTCQGPALSAAVMTQLAKTRCHTPPLCQKPAKELGARRKGRALKGLLVWIVVPYKTVQTQMVSISNFLKYRRKKRRTWHRKNPVLTCQIPWIHIIQNGLVRLKIWCGLTCFHMKHDLGKGFNIRKSLTKGTWLRLDQGWPGCIFTKINVMFYWMEPLKYSAGEKNDFSSRIKS